MEMDIATFMAKVSTKKTFFAFVSARVGEGSEPRFPAWITLLGTGMAQTLREANIVWGANEPNKNVTVVVRGWWGL